MNAPETASSRYVLEASPLSRAEIEILAKQQRSQLDLSFINSLGTPFVALLFRHIQESPVGCLITARERASGAIVGHISAASDLRSLYRGFVVRHGLRAAWLARRALTPSGCARALETLWYPRRSRIAALPAAELLTFTIEQPHRGSGLSVLLYDELMRTMKAHGVRAIKVVTTATLVHFHAFLRHRGWKQVGDIRLHPGEEWHSLVFAYREGSSCRTS